MQVSQNIGKDHWINDGISSIKQFCLLAILLSEPYDLLSEPEMEIQSTTDLNRP